MVLYLDGVMGFNFLVDWLLLLGVNRLSGFPPNPGRSAAAALFGGGYSGLCLVPGFAFLASALWKSISLGIMSAAAFGLSRSAWSRGMLFVVLSMALGGLAFSMNVGSVPGLILTAGTLALLCRMGFRGEGVGKTLVPVRIRLSGREVSFLALMDTGNTLRDPMTGTPVVVAGAEAARRLTGLTEEQLSSPVETAASDLHRRFRLLPYRAVGTEHAFLLGIRCDRVEIRGKPAGRLVALTPEPFEGMDYEGLTGGVL